MQTNDVVQSNDDPYELMSLPAPSVAAAVARGFAESRFGLTGELQPLASERDQNFRLTTANGETAVLKISNAGESPAVLDFQAKALEHIARQAPHLPVPHIVRGVDGEALQRLDTPQGVSLVRLVSWLDGMPVETVPSTPPLRRNMARMLAELGLHLRGFFHPSARHPLLWNVGEAEAVRPLARHIKDRARRSLAESNLERHARYCAPLLPGLRAQVIHNDCNPDNVLVSAADLTTVCGIIDFGDMVHAPLVNDLAVAIAYQLVGQPDPLTTACEMLAAYQSVYPLEADEIDVLFDLVKLRLTMSVCICNWRALEHADNVAYILGSHERYWQTLETLASLDARAAGDALRRAAGLPGRGALRAWTGEAEAALRRRREALLGPSLRLSYDRPLHIVRGEGAWLYDAGGRPYLDAYNNVACVGHSHPAVADALAAQAHRLNTNTRYLHEHIVDYAERLGQRFPGELSVCFFVCTGSEANDLAWQIACAASGGSGAIVTEHAYHGNTTAVAQLSPEELGPGRQEEWVVTVPAPDSYRGVNGTPAPDVAAGERFAAHLDTAIDTLAARGRRVAGFFADTIYTSDGIHIAPPGYLAAAWQKVRAAGGLCIADEVQAGFGRTGEHLWGFEQQGVVPDIVTLGKPMGNGHPLAAVVTTPAIAAAFAAGRYYFNTFGGNPVSCAAGLAVLDVLERERLQENAREVGRYLRARLASLMSAHALVGDVRGSGLIYGVELVQDRGSRAPAADAAREIVNEMRREGVLIGRTGRLDNVLKIRPPLVFARENADQLADTLDKVLRDKG